MNPPSPRLVITDAAGRRQVPIDKGVVTLGRRSESDVRVAGTGVSRQHAEITADRPDNDLPRVEADPDLHLHPVLAPHVVRVALQRLLHPERRIARPHRVVLVGERCAE